MHTQLLKVNPTFSLKFVDTPILQQRMQLIQQSPINVQTTMVRRKHPITLH